ncbi:TM2 domain-containing protein [Nocardia arthritidis]|uniref:TM2 domain-containing protein n=1 Tax=Nocardia arthritidis TaxID=228602 RepID=UPI0007A53489|nr:TM2 domain-containing protein [Nocardia arthritidis]
MTDPYQQNPDPGGPQYGPPGTGPDLTKPLDAQSRPPYSAPSDPYGQPQYSPPSNPYGQPADPYGQQPGGYPAGPYPVAPQGYNPNDPEAPWGRDPFGVPLSDKQKLVAGLLQIFLGSFGVGRFYLGYTGLGVAQLVVGILTCFTVGWIWGIVDGVLMLTGKVPDSNGRPLRD